MALSHYGKSYLGTTIKWLGLLGLGLFIYNHYQNGHTNDTLGYVFAVMFLIGLYLETTNS